MNGVKATKTVFCFFINGRDPITTIQLRHAFQQLVDHRPALLFIDRIDAISIDRSDALPPYNLEHNETTKRTVHTELTRLLDPLNLPPIIRVIVTTKKAEFLDSRLRDVFDREIKMPIPDAHARVQILQKCFEKMNLVNDVSLPIIVTDVSLPIIAGKTDGYVGADLAALCSGAAVEQFQRQIGIAASEGGSGTPGLVQRNVTMEDFEAALATFPPGASC